MNGDPNIFAAVAVAAMVLLWARVRQEERSGR
jgi:hypothetical protein